MIFDVNHSLINTLKQHFEVEYLATVESTNDYAKEKAKGLVNPMAIVSSMQTSGRGRRENIWYQRVVGEQLNLSICLPIERPAQYFASALTGLCLCESLLKIWPNIPFSLKAPNDIFIGPHKIGGLLCESISMGEKNWIVLGLGLNGFSSPFEFTTDLNKELLKEGERLELNKWTQLFESFCTQLISTLPAMCEKELSADHCGALLDHYKKNSLHADLIEVLPDASLVSIGGTIRWSDQ